MAEHGPGRRVCLARVRARGWAGSGPIPVLQSRYFLLDHFHNIGGDDLRAANRCRRRSRLSLISSRQELLGMAGDRLREDWGGRFKAWSLMFAGAEGKDYQGSFGDFPLACRVD